MVFVGRFKILGDLYERFKKNEVPAISAQVTYYLILSFFPFLILLFTLLGYTNLITDESLLFLSSWLPESVYNLIQEVAQNVVDSRNEALISFGMLATLWSSSAGAISFIRSINKAYDLKETRSFWRLRFLSVFFVLALVMIIIFSFILIVFGGVLTRYLLNMLGITRGAKSLLDIIRFILILVTLFTAFVLFYYYGPNCRIYVKDVIPGAILSSTGWLAISIGFSFYVSNFGNFSKTYGSLGAIIVLLIWLYWSSIIIILGGELNGLLHKRKYR